MDQSILVEIYYFRGSWFRDGKVADNECIPYLFRDGVPTFI